MRGEARDRAWVRGGRLELANKARFIAELKALEGSLVTVRVYRPISKRARGYYRAQVLAKLAEATGHDADFMHEILKRKFNPAQIEFTCERTGEVTTDTVGGSFEDLGSAHFARVLDRIIWWGRDFIGADIREPSPEERAEMEDPAMRRAS